MYKVVQKWEMERFEKKNEDAFAEVFDNLFAEDEEEEETLQRDGDDEESESEDGDESELYSEDEFESDLDSAFEPWGDEDEEDDEDYDWGIELPSGDCRLEEIRDIQERFMTLRNGGFIIEPEFLDNDYYTVCNTCEYFWYDDYSPTTKDLFISKHQNGGGDLRRCSPRLLGKRGAPLRVELATLECV